MKKIIILDFKRGEVFVYNYDTDIWEDGEDFIESEEINLNSNDCQWMIVDELNIQIK
jgi:hypothetical protein